MASNFNDTTPAAPAGFTNVSWATDGSGNDSAAVQVPTYAADSGTVNAYVITGVPTPITGSTYQILIANANSGASTLTVDGGSPAPITKNGTTALVGTELI